MHAEGHAPGRIALLGSGETSLAGGRVFESLARVLPAPLKVAVMETPAGFELNSGRVAGRVADFLNMRLQNYRPDVRIVPARKRGGPDSTDDPGVTDYLLRADLIFMGPGSPTYAVRQLTGSLAWHRMIARQRVGATLALASAAIIAAGAFTLPVYEIYKVGQDLHWQAGLDLFGPYGLELVLVPHWNNAEGGSELDTTRCFMGQERFEELLTLLPANAMVVGIDEHTALAIDLDKGTAEVMGAGDVNVIRCGDRQQFVPGTRFPLTELGPFRWPEPEAGLPPEVWAEVLSAAQADAEMADEDQPVPDQVMALVAERQAARARRDWPASDALRAGIAALGWQVKDTPEGPVVAPAVPER